MTAPRRLPPRPSRTTRRGASLAELLVVLSLLGGLSALGLPYLIDALAQAALRAAATDVAIVFMTARHRAIFQSREVGVKWFSSGGDVVLSVYEDGNGNGVTTADIKKGIDRLVAGPYWMKGKYPGISFSFLPQAPNVDPGGDPIGDVTDPIRFGRSDICSFSPKGHASPGSVYLSNGKKRQSVVRVTPMTGRIQIFDWMGKTQKWVRRW